MSGSDALSGLANTTQVLGGALITIPIATHKVPLDLPTGRPGRMPA